MKLEDIGFYTLSDARAKQASAESPLWRGEVLLTDRCNFNCPYCRSLREDCKGDMDYDYACYLIDLMTEHGLKNIRFSGGEPTLYNDLDLLILKSKRQGVQRVALSTNGTEYYKVYEYYIKCGVDDFSISLDACCGSIGSMMNGGNMEMWGRSVDNIRKLSKETYVTVGIVFTEKTADKILDVIKFASSLGVADIRIISSAQYNRALGKLAYKFSVFPILDKHPILRYRVGNYDADLNVRGLMPADINKCFLVLDDLAIAGKYHFPCIIYLREGGAPIGEMGPDFRQERLDWFKMHDTHVDKICRKNCLDVCIGYNNRVANFRA